MHLNTVYAPICCEKCSCAYYAKLALLASASFIHSAFTHLISLLLHPWRELTLKLLLSLSLVLFRFFFYFVVVCLQRELQISNNTIDPHVSYLFPLQPPFRVSFSLLFLCCPVPLAMLHKTKPDQAPCRVLDMLSWNWRKLLEFYASQSGGQNGK